MAASPSHAVRQLKAVGEHPVWLVHRPGEQPRTLKTWTVTPVRLVQLAIGTAPPQRQIAGATLLERAGVRTPAMCGSWRFARRRRVIELEYDYVEGRSAWELAKDERTPREEIRRVSAAAGDVVGAMLAAGLLNKDLKLNNLVVADDGPVWIIDTDGVRRCRDRVTVAARMLERLGVQLSIMGSRVGPEVWLPAVRRVLRSLPRQERPAVVRTLRAHRSLG